MVWAQWVMATALGWIVGAGLGSEIGIGAMIGVLQWLILRPHIRRAGWWAPATAIGWSAGWLLVIAMLPPEQSFLAGIVVGTCVGVLQWLVLQRGLHRAGWWVIVSALGWAASMTSFAGVLLVGAAAGAVTGIALELLLRYPRLRKQVGV